ncbi:MAG: helix-turn-helix transcriptional regulator, partial [Ktedonobacteraceae bacterium]|nr:helix-turn-helix transcriptional regulator [Ktedonobacteraceae bacterium]
MPETTFWGVKGEFGPFTRQADGWPNAGEVIRYYRKRLEMSAETLAQKYGEATDTHITARWILKMEQHNRVPTDIVRRRVLANLLHIPPMLLGLASLEAVTYRSATTFQPPTVL